MAYFLYFEGRSREELETLMKMDGEELAERNGVCSGETLPQCRSQQETAHGQHKGKGRA